MNNRKIDVFIFSCFLIGPHDIHAQTPHHILEDFTLVWHDEFSGEQLDTNKWNHRDLGKLRCHGVVAKENAYLDKSGRLVIQTSKKDSSYHIGQIASHNTYFNYIWLL